MQDAGEYLLNSPRSGRVETCGAVNADGYSRDRVKVCRHLRCVLRGEEEWYRGRTEFGSFVSLQGKVDVRAFCYPRVSLIGGRNERQPPQKTYRCADNN